MFCPALGFVGDAFPRGRIAQPSPKILASRRPNWGIRLRFGDRIAQLPYVCSGENPSRHRGLRSLAVPAADCRTNRNRARPCPADHLGVSVTTARTQLQRMFEKTGARSQPALVRALLSFPSPM